MSTSAISPSARPLDVKTSQNASNAAPGPRPIDGPLIDPNESPSNSTYEKAETSPPFQYNASLHTLDTTASQSPTSANLHTPISGLRLQTDQLAQKNKQESRNAGSDIIAESPGQTNFNAGLPVRHSSIRSTHSARRHGADSYSPASVASSPGVGPLVDMTPLPSPMSAWGSPTPWRRSIDEEMVEAPAEAQEANTSSETASVPVDYEKTSPKKRKIPFVGQLSNDQRAQVAQANAAAHARNRSLSDYRPEGMQVPRARNIAVSSSIAPPIGQAFSPPDETMHREQCLAVQRGIAIAKPPTPPDSNRGGEGDDNENVPSSNDPKPSPSLYYEATTVRSGKPKRWRALRQLGEGTFSRVMLATSGEPDDQKALDPAKAELSLDPASLVAVKLCNHGPAGGPSEKSVETSIKRELDLMKLTSHPSLVHLRAVSNKDRQTLFVLNYCPGGDLFELASTKLDLLKPPMVRRIFAELVDAVRYLHLQYICHRDIKLENILVNIRTEEIPQVTDWQKFNKPIVTLSDLGLGREVPRPPESPLLRRRCGSEDYAAPEVLIGQDYDGRSTDAWALGVVLYTLMEGRMPFDPVPGSKHRRPTSHKIASCDWQWVRWADAEGEWDPAKEPEFEGAREVVEGLIARKRDRWDLEKVQKTDWVAGGIQVNGGLKLEDHDD